MVANHFKFWLLCFVMAASHSAQARRTVFVALPHSDNFVNRSGAWMDYECHFVNPSTVQQTVTVYGYFVDGRPNEMKNSPQRRTLLNSIRLNANDSYNWYDRTDFPIPLLARQPNYLEIEIAEDTGFMMGGCMYSNDFQTNVGSGNSATNQSGIEIPINGGKAF